MNNSETIQIVVNVIMAMGLFYLQKTIKSSDESNAKRREDERQYMMAKLELLLADSKLTRLTAKKVNDSKSVNGELEKAISYVLEKEHELENLTNRIAQEHLND